MKTSADKSYQLLAARYFHKQINALARQFKGIQENTDIECVHKARVASRRIRTGLDMFQECFPAKRVNKWRKEIRRLIRKLGSARDKDVAILCLQHTIDELDEGKFEYGLARLILRLKQQRESLQPKVVKSLERIESSKVLEEMFTEMGGIIFGLERYEMNMRNTCVFRQCQKHILEKMSNLLACQECLANPRDEKGHHKMRIRAKRLRYTLEICRDVYEGKLDDSINKLKEMQTLLGDIHDCDVWLENLPHFLDEERRHMAEYFGHTRSFSRLKMGIDYFRKDRYDMRQSLFTRLVDSWGRWENEGLWDSLSRSLLTQA